MDDATFDALFPSAIGRVAGMFWTSVVVARRAAEIMADLGVRRVLDLGSGPGKFCVAGAARAPRIAFVGVEHRPHLVAIAQSVAGKAGLENVAFSIGDATRVPWTDFDALYVYNSFAENDFAVDDQLDQTVELSRARHVAEAKRVARRLAGAPTGTVVLTYHGMSAPIPGSYDLVRAEIAGTGWLRTWRKGALPARDRFWLEEGPDVNRWRSRTAMEDDETCE